MLDEISSLEGGFSDNPYDSGGATNYGVTQRTLDGWRAKNGGLHVTGIPENVRDLTVGQARKLLQDTSYDDYQLNRIKDYDVARHIFDMLINTKPGSVRDFVYGAIDDVMRRQSLHDEHQPSIGEPLPKAHDLVPFIDPGRRLEGWDGAEGWVRGPGILGGGPSGNDRQRR